MCDFAVDVAEVAARHDRPVASVAGAWTILERFAEDELIEIDGQRLSVTALGRPFVRAVCAAFDPAAVAIANRHARVV